MVNYYERYIKIIRKPIRKALKLGYKKEEIELKLKNKNWPKHIIDDAFKAALKDYEVSKKKLVLTILYWLGLLVAVTSFVFSQYFIVLISIGIVLMLLSVPMRISDWKKQKEKKAIKPTGPLTQLIPLSQAKKQGLLSKIFNIKPKPGVPVTTPLVKKEWFFSRWFKVKSKPEKKIEEPKKPEKKKEKPFEKRLIVKKGKKLKSPILALILSIIPGLGHFYLGQTKKGIIILLTFWLIAPYIYGFIDSYKLAIKQNLEVAPPDLKKLEQEKEKKKKKRKRPFVGIMLFFSIIALFYILWLYQYQPGVTLVNAVSYSVVIIIITFILVPILRKASVKGLNIEEKEVKQVKKVEIEDLRKHVSQRQDSYETDFDKLHQIVEKYGRIKISDIAETFKISKKEAEEWASILERHGLATIYYPALGSPEIVKKKKKKVEEGE